MICRIASSNLTHVLYELCRLNGTSRWSLPLSKLPSAYTVNHKPCETDRLVITQLMWSSILSVIYSYSIDVFRKHR